MTGVGGDSSRSLPSVPLAWLGEAQGAWFQVLGIPHSFAPPTVAGRGLSNGMMVRMEWAGGSLPPFLLWLPESKSL